MADLVRTAANVRVTHPHNAEIYDAVAGEDIQPGQPVYQLSTGKYGVADANAGSGKEQARGIALGRSGASTTIKAGQGFSLVKRGFMAGWTISQAYDARVYLSDTVGEIADAASATHALTVGRVQAISDDPDFTKAIYFAFDWNNQVA